MIARRQKWLNSITVGKRTAELEETMASESGVPQGTPIRLPAVDEMRRHQQNGGADPMKPNGGGLGSSVLGPARDMLAAHPDYSMGGLPLNGPVPPSGTAPDGGGRLRSRMGEATAVEVGGWGQTA